MFKYWFLGCFLVFGMFFKTTIIGFGALEGFERFIGGSFVLGNILCWMVFR